METRPVIRGQGWHRSLSGWNSPLETSKYSKPSSFGELSYQNGFFLFAHRDDSGVKGTVFRLGQSSALSLSSCFLTSGKSLNLSDPLFPHLERGIKISL